MEKGRLAELDSLRGLAALSVVLFHFQSFWERAKLPIWERVGVLGPLRLVSSGHEAVLLFFLMSEARARRLSGVQLKAANALPSAL